MYVVYDIDHNEIYNNVHEHMLLNDKMVKFYEQFYLLLNVEDYLLKVILMVVEMMKKKKKVVEVKVELDIVEQEVLLMNYLNVDFVVVVEKVENEYMEIVVVLDEDEDLNLNLVELNKIKNRY